MRGLRCQTGGFGEFAGSILSTALSLPNHAAPSNQTRGEILGMKNVPTRMTFLIRKDHKGGHQISSQSLTSFVSANQSMKQCTFVKLFQDQLLHHSGRSMLVDFKRHQCSAVVPSSILCQPTNSLRRSSYCPIALSKCLEVAKLTNISQFYSFCHAMLSM